MGLSSVLVLTDGLDDQLALASRNLRDVLVLEAHQAAPVSLIRFPRVVLTKAALAKMEEMLS
jgi:large subunit ribosomal protein L4